MCLEIIYLIELLLVTLVEGEQKAYFSIATTPWCRGGRYSFPGIDSYLILLDVKQGGIKYHFKNLWYDIIVKKWAQTYLKMLSAKYLQIICM